MEDFLPKRLSDNSVLEIPNESSFNGDPVSSVAHPYSPLPSTTSVSQETGDHLPPAELTQEDNLSARISHAKLRSVSGKTVFLELLDAQPPTIQDLKAFGCFVDIPVPVRSPLLRSHTSPTLDSSAMAISSPSRFHGRVGPLSPKSPNLPTSPSFMPSLFQGRRSSSLLGKKVSSQKGKEDYPLSPKLAKEHPSPRKSRSASRKAPEDRKEKAEAVGQHDGGETRSASQRPPGPERSVSFVDPSETAEQSEAHGIRREMSEGHAPQTSPDEDSSRRYSLPTSSLQGGQPRPQSAKSPRFRIVELVDEANGYSDSGIASSGKQSAVDERRMSFDLARIHAARDRSASPAGSEDRRVSISSFRDGELDRRRKHSFLGIALPSSFSSTNVSSSDSSFAESAAEGAHVKPGYGRRSLSASIISLGKKVAQLGNTGGREQDKSPSPHRQTDSSSAGTPSIQTPYKRSFEVVSPRGSYPSRPSSSRPSSPLVQSTHSATDYTSDEEAGNAAADDLQAKEPKDASDQLLSPSFLVTNRPKLARNAKSDDGQKVSPSKMLSATPLSPHTYAGPTSPLAKTVISAASKDFTVDSPHYRGNAPSMLPLAAKSPGRSSNPPGLDDIVETQREKEGWNGSVVRVHKGRTARRMSAVDVFAIASATGTATMTPSSVAAPSSLLEESGSPAPSAPLESGELDFTKKPISPIPCTSDDDSSVPLSGRHRTTSYSSLLSSSRPATPNSALKKAYQFPASAASPTPPSRQFDTYQRHRASRSMTALPPAPSFSGYMSNSSSPSVADSTHAKFAAALQNGCTPSSTSKQRYRSASHTHLSGKEVIVIDKKGYRTRMESMGQRIENAVEDDSAEDGDEEGSGSSEVSIDRTTQARKNGRLLPKLSYGSTDREDGQQEAHSGSPSPTSTAPFASASSYFSPGTATEAPTKARTQPPSAASSRKPSFSYVPQYFDNAHYSAPPTALLADYDARERLDQVDRKRSDSSARRADNMSSESQITVASETESRTRTESDELFGRVAVW